MDSRSFILSLPISARKAVGKRLFDIVFSSAVLVFGAPVFALICLSIKLSSPGKILFIQERVGRGGKLFRCLKFRTMHENAEEMLKEILGTDLLLKKQWNEKQKLLHDPRTFLFGRFLRKTSLDELPQFWNVLKGELSVVGPRPYIPAQMKLLGPQKYKILSVRPGLTGLWQISGRSNTTFLERITLDAGYVDRHHFLLDILLIAKTIPEILFSKDAC